MYHTRFNRARMKSQTSYHRRHTVFLDPSFDLFAFLVEILCTISIAGNTFIKHFCQQTVQADLHQV